MIEQGSEEWLLERVGHLTASRFADATAEIKSGEAASVENYRAELIVERLTGEPYPQFVTQEMRDGSENEPLARAEYEALCGCAIDTAGFVKHAWIPWFGASPDGIAGGGLVEFKCPKSATHIRYLRAAKKYPGDPLKIIPGDYRKQMLAQACCTEAPWIDWVSFDPRMPPHLRLLVVRFVPTREQIEKAEEAAVAFLSSVVETMKDLGEK